MKKQNVAKPHRNSTQRETRFAQGLMLLLASACIVLLVTACTPLTAGLVLANTAAHAPVPLAAADDDAAVQAVDATEAATASAAAFFSVAAKEFSYRAKSANT